MKKFLLPILFLVALCCTLPTLLRATPQPIAPVIVDANGPYPLPGSGGPYPMPAPVPHLPSPPAPGWVPPLPPPAPPPADMFDNPYCGAAAPAQSLYVPNCGWDQCPDYVCLDAAYAQFVACCNVWSAQACAAYNQLLQAYMDKVATASNEVSQCMANGGTTATCRAEYQAKKDVAKAQFDAAALTLASNYANNISVCAWVYGQAMLACGCIQC